MERTIKSMSVKPVFMLVSFILLLLHMEWVKAEEKTATVISTAVICKEPGRYIGWPSIAKTHEGELIAVFSGDRDEHHCPWGKTQMVRSIDNGKTWTEPVTINNTPLDDRDAGIIVTEKGTLIVSWFTYLEPVNPSHMKYFSEEITKFWKRHMEKIGPETRKRWLGCWIRRSTDGGYTWEEPVRVQGNSPHGPIQLRDGRILYVGNTPWANKESLSVEESLDDGRTWKRIGTISVRPGEDIEHYWELHAVELDNGKLIAMIRYEPEGDRDNYIMRQTESTDGGKTWTVPHSTGIWGYPPHLIRLKDGRLVVVYGHRRVPFGERACISSDGGKTWDVEHAIEIASAPDSDLGYPASAELDDGSIFTVYYQIDKEGEKTCLMGTHWQLK